MQNLLLRLVRRPWWTLLFGLCLAVLSLGLAFSRLRFTTDRTQLLDPRDKVQVDWSRYVGEFGRQLDYVVLVRARDEESAREATDAMGLLLGKSPYFHQVFYRLSIPEAATHGLYFIEREQLSQLVHWLTGARPWLALVARHQGPGGIMRELSRVRDERRLARALRPILPLLLKLLHGFTASLETGGRAAFVSPLGPFQADVDQLAGRALDPGESVFYNQLADGRTFMLLALPRDTSGSFEADVAALEEIQSLAGQVRRSVPDAEILISGEPAINTEEMKGASRDALRCALTALLVVSGLLVMAYGQVVRPLCAVLGLLLGLSWSFGFAALTLGQLNLLTVHFATILTGLGITFTIQLLSRYREARAMGCTAYEAVVDSLPEARHQAVGAVATAVAFFSLHFTSFRAAAELGLVTGVGVLLCYLATLTMVPSLLILAEGRQPARLDPEALHHSAWLAPLEIKLRRHPRLVALVCLAWTMWCCRYIGRIPFDYNLLRMQPPGAEAIRVENLLQRIGYSTLYAVSLAPDMDSARQRAALLSRLPSVSRVESVIALEPHEIEAKRPLVKALVELAPRLEIPGKPLVLDSFEMLEAYNGYLKLKSRLLGAARHLQDDPDGPRLVEALKRLDGLLDLNNPGPLSSGIESYQKAFFKDLREHIRFLRTQQTEPPNLLAMVPEELRIRSISPRGSICLRIFPNEDPWEHRTLSDFVRQLRKVDPEITGTPVLIYSYLGKLRRAYSVSGRNALIVIVVLLLLYYRSLSCAGLALLPKLTGVVWMLGCLGLLHAEFNAANFLALPLTLGIGLIFGIESLRMCRQPGCTLMARHSAGSAVFLSALTTLLGFSTLMLAQHRGVASFGLVMAIGVAMNLLTSLVMLPALMDWTGLRCQTVPDLED